MVPKLILFPIILILILGKVFDNGSGTKISKFEVAIENQDAAVQIDKSSNISLGDILKNKVLKSDKAKELFDVTEVTSEDQGRQLVSEGKAITFIYIPKDYTSKYMNNKNSEVKFIGNKKNDIDVSIVKNIINNFGEGIKVSSVTKAEIIKKSAGIPRETLNEIIAKISDSNSDNSTIKSVPTKESQKPITSMQYYSIAMIAMFSITTAFILVQYMIDEKLNKTYFRIKTTPLKGIQYVFGKLLGIVFTITVQMTILIIITHFLYAMDWGNILYTELITVTYCFAIGSIVLLAGFLSEDHRTITSIQPAIFFLFSFLGGSMVQKTQFPDSLDLIQQIVPNGQALNAYLKLVQGGSFSDVKINLCILLTIGLVFFGVSIVVYSEKWRVINETFRSNKVSEQTAIQ